MKKFVAALLCVLSGLFAPYTRIWYNICFARRNIEKWRQSTEPRLSESIPEG